MGGDRDVGWRSFVFQFLGLPTSTGSITPPLLTFDDLVFAGTTRLSHSSYGNLGGADGDFDMNSITLTRRPEPLSSATVAGEHTSFMGRSPTTLRTFKPSISRFNSRGNRTIDLANGDITIGGVISQDGSNRGFTQIGTGTLTLNGANTYAGTTGIGITNGATAGTVIVTNNSALGTGTVSFGAGGTLVLGIDGLTIGKLCIRAKSCRHRSTGPFSWISQAPTRGR